MSTSDDLAFIRQLMEGSRRVTVLGGHYFVVWGLLVAIAQVAIWILIERDLINRLNSTLVWLLVVVIGYAYTFWASARDRRVEGAESRDGYLIGRVWIAFGVCGLTIALAGLAIGALPGRSLAGVYATLSGMAFFLHGTLAGIGWLRNVGVLWWLASIPLFLMTGPIIMLAYAVLILLLQVVPGILLTFERRRLLASETQSA